MILMIISLMPWFRFSLVLAILLLLIALTANAQTVVQPCYCTWHYWNFTFTSPGYIVLASADPHTFNLAVFTARNYDLWWAGNAEPAVYYGSISYGDMVAIPITEPGNYTVVIYPTPNLQYIPLVYAWRYYSLSLPIGIASFPRSPIITGGVEGYFEVSAISAYNPNGESQYNVPNSGASLQLNAVVVVELANGQKQYYWVQDIISFITDRDEFHIWDNVWNYTTWPSVLSSQAITGNGEVYLYKQTNSQYYYYGTPFNTYTLPMSSYLIMRAYPVDGSVRIDFGYELGSGGVVWYDHVTIMPYEPVINAYFEVGAQMTSTYTPMDAELVFTGYANYEWTNITNISAELRLYYWNGSAWLPLPSDYDFGVYTGEAVFTDVNVTVHNGLFVLSAPGPFTPGLVYLPQYLMSVVSPIPILVNGVETTNYTAWLIGGESLTISNHVLVLGNGTMFVPSIGNETIVVNKPMNITIDWKTYYLVRVYSTLPIYINGVTETTNYTGWIRNGEALTIVDYNYVLNNGTMFVPSVGNETIVVANPVSLVINWYPKYLVIISSALPIGVNGELTTNYTAWLSPGFPIALTTHVYVLPNGTMLIPSTGNETITVNAPTTLAINWSPRYLIDITSTMPIYINGQLVNNYTAWLSPGTTLTIQAPTYSAYGGLVLYQPNTTSVTLTINKPTKLTITYTPNYTRAIILTIVVIVIIAVALLLMRRRRVS